MYQSHQADPDRSLLRRAEPVDDVKRRHLTRMSRDSLSPKVRSAEPEMADDSPGLVKSNVAQRRMAVIIGINWLRVRASPYGTIASCSGRTASEALGLQVLPAQHRWCGKIGIRPCSEPCGQKSAQLREILWAQRSNVAGHGYGCGAVFPLICPVRLNSRRSSSVPHADRLIESRAVRHKPSHSSIEPYN